MQLCNCIKFQICFTIYVFICFCLFVSLNLEIIIKMKTLVNILYGLALFAVGMMLNSIFALLTAFFQWPVAFVYMTSLLPILLPTGYFILKYAIR